MGHLVVVTEYIDPIGIEILKEYANVHYDPDLWRDGEQLRAAVQEADALVVRNQTKVGEGLVGPRLKVVGRLGVGLDNLDMATLRSRGVRVVAGVGANAVAVTEYVLAYCFHVARPLPNYDAMVREGLWDRVGSTGHEVFGKVLGIAGLGDIGRRLAVRAAALGMRVAAYDPWVKPFDMALQDLSIELLELEDLCRCADFLSVHVPKTPETLGLIGPREIRWMKPTAHLINTSRGGVVDEDALYEALQDGRIGGAGLDVRLSEPPTRRDRFLTLSNVLLTPHIGGWTSEAQERTARMVAENVRRILAGARAHGEIALG